MKWHLDCVRAAESLANHTSFRIGGPAELFAEPSTVEELADVVRMARRSHLPISVLGGGTNCLVADRGISGLVLHLGRAFRTVDRVSSDDSSARVRCGAAILTQHLVLLAGRYGWGDVDVLAGLPGQVGGAVVMNAQNIGQFVERVTMVSFDGELLQIPRERLQFSYRYAAIDPGIISHVEFRFPQLAVEVAGERIRQVLRHRNETQDLQLPSAGCAFKNPAGTSAGRLIDPINFSSER